MKKIDDHPELTEHMWSEIDGTDKGQVSRDAMFHHLKEARDINIIEDAHTNAIEEVKKAPVASILASVPIKKAENEEEEAFGISDKLVSDVMEAVDADADEVVEDLVDPLHPADVAHLIEQLDDKDSLLSPDK